MTDCNSMGIIAALVGSCEPRRAPWASCVCRMSYRFSPSPALPGRSAKHSAVGWKVARVVDVAAARVRWASANARALLMNCKLRVREP